MKELEQLVHSRFDQYNKMYFDKEPIKLYEPLLYTMNSGGKRIRPLLALLSCQLFNGDIEKMFLPAYGLELFHNFTLLHDDIMDNSDLRRGKPTVHKKYGLNSGILSGDLMMILALKLASQIDGEVHKEMYNLMLETSVELYEGQQFDIDFEERNDVRQEEYLKMIELKTAVLLGCSLKLGAIVSQADKNSQNRIYEFGRNIGLSFQIQDDYLDTFGGQQVGKKIGGDILNNKKTLLLISALQKATKSQKELLNKWINITDQDEEKIEIISQLFIDTGAMEYCKNLSLSYFDKALDFLNKIENINPEAKNKLIEIAELIIKRKF